MAPICTPFAGDGEVDHDALRQNIAKYNRTALAGFVVAGTTGEAAFLGREEKRKLFETVRELRRSPDPDRGHRRGVRARDACV